MAVFLMSVAFPSAGLRPSQVPSMAGALPPMGAVQRMPMQVGAMDGVRLMPEGGQGTMRSVDMGRREDGLGMRVQLSADGTHPGEGCNPKKCCGILIGL